MLTQLYNILPLDNQAVKNVYLFGSRVYGTATPASDYDFIVVGKNLKYQELTTNNFNVHLFSARLFQENLAAHDMRAVECWLAPPFARLKEELDFTWKLVPKFFRAALFQQVAKNWRVAKRKLEEGDVYGGKKRIYHSLRLLLFGHDILQNGKITLWGEGNIYHRHLQNDAHTEWDYFRLHYELEKQKLETRLNKLIK